MKIYHYHFKTGEFLSTGEADADPMVEGNYLIPANATTEEPPEAEENKVLVFSDGNWSLVDDYRGTTYWTDYQTSFTISEIGVTVPDDAYLEQPEAPEPTAEEVSAQNMVLRESAYSNALTGSDRHFMEAARKRAAGDEDGAVESESLGLARVAEIQEQYPV